MLQTRILQIVKGPPSGMYTLPHDRSGLLCMDGDYLKPTPLFLESIDKWTGAMLFDDKARGTNVGKDVEGLVLSKTTGMVSGIPVIERLVGIHFPYCELSWFVKEGGIVSNMDRVLSIRGPSSSVLSCERILLNFLGRLSGISSQTMEWVKESTGIAVACTRKTAWGVLDKWAVHVGGGLTHRLSKLDSPMIKENDIASFDPPVNDPELAMKIAVRSIDVISNSSFAVIEVRDTGQALTAATEWSDVQSRNNLGDKIVLLLDNMGPDKCRMAHESLLNSGQRENCILEGSGGIEKRDLKQWMGSGVDLISSSKVNMAAPMLDLSLVVGDL